MPSAADTRLRRWALALIALFGLLVGGTWMTVKVTTSYLLEHDAAEDAREWAEFLAANVADLEQIAGWKQARAGELRRSPADKGEVDVWRQVRK